MRRTIITLLVVASSPALALDANVRNACIGDYFRFCSHTLPGSAPCRACFRQTGVQLSARCLAAIRDSAEYGQEYQRLAKRYARR